MTPGGQLPAADRGDGLPESVLVVGAGLLGTSLGLALRRRGVVVWLSDSDPRAQALAADLGAGVAGLPQVAPDVVLVAVPPAAILSVTCHHHRLFPGSIFSDVGSVKTRLQLDIETMPALAERFVGGHPLAGRERSGPGAARADLFEGRAWVLTPGPLVPPTRVAVIRGLVQAAGAVPVLQTPQAHDVAVALVSHLPQVVASLLAARLVDAPSAALELAGSGLRDTTRVAASDPGLWTQILEANAGAVLPVLDALAADLDRVRAALQALDAGDRETELSTNRLDDKTALSVVRSVLEAGRAGRQAIPGKHGGRAVAYSLVPVVIPDEPGALARLFAAAGEAGANIEDVAIEHSPGQPVGLVELSVAPDRVAALTRALRSRGWQVH